MQKQSIYRQECRNGVLLRKCSAAGYCWTSAQKHGIAGHVCRSSVLMGDCAEAAVLLRKCAEVEY